MSSVIINLLPETRLKKLKEQHQKQTAIGIMALVVVGASVTLFVGFLVVTAQSLRIGALTKEIDGHRNEIVAIKNVDEILATKQRLEALNNLNDKKVRLSVFLEIIQRVSPKDISIQSLSLDEDNVITLTGSADNYATASTLATAMDAIKVTVKKDQVAAFSDIKLSKVSSDQTGKVTFTISAVVTKGVTNGR